MSDHSPTSPSSEKEYQPEDTMGRYVDGKLKIEHVEPTAKRGNSLTGRALSVATDNGRQYSTGGARRMSEWDAMRIAKEGGVEIDEEIELLEIELRENPIHGSFFSPVINFKNPAYFTYLLVAFASMGGLLSGIDQSLISGANLYMPTSLHLNTSQVSLVASGVPLGAIGGALLLGPTNEAFGRRMAIIISLILYTVGAALEAGAINYGMMVTGRVILGLGVGLEGGTVPVYVAESVARKYRGNLVSLYQFNIALGEVFGYVVAAIFVNVKVSFPKVYKSRIDMLIHHSQSGSWRYMLGSSLVFSTIMLVGMLFMPESPRFLMHKGRTLQAFNVWKRIRGTELPENREEFFVMKHAVLEELNSKDSRSGSFAWLDFFTVPRARRSIIYANIMIFLGQFTGINAMSVNTQSYHHPLLQLTHPQNVLHGHPHEPSRLRLQTIRLHVPRRRWLLAPRYNPRNILHGTFRPPLLGLRHAPRLLYRPPHNRLQIHHRLQNQRRLRRTHLHYRPNHLRRLLRLLRLPHLGPPRRSLPHLSPQLRHGNLRRHAFLLLLARYVFLC